MGNVIESAKDFWSITRFNKFGKERSYIDSDGMWAETSFNKNGLETNYEDSDNFKYDITYNKDGNELQYIEGQLPPQFLIRNTYK